MDIRLLSTQIYNKDIERCELLPRIKGKRAKKWEVSMRHDIISKKLEAQHEIMTELISRHYNRLDEIYEDVARILDEEGVIAQQRLLYRSFAEEMYKISQNLTRSALENQGVAIQHKYIAMGADPDILDRIRLLLGVPPTFFLIQGVPFKERRLIEITEQSGNDLIDYPIFVKLDSSNFDFDKARSDGGDIRFADKEGNFLDYWCEKYDYANKIAWFWVEVPYIPANKSTSIYMYYGSPTLLTASNGEATFTFFDGFEDKALDPAKWDTDGFAGFPGVEGYYSIENSMLKLWSDGTWRILRALVNIVTDDRMCIEWKLSREDTACDPHYGITDSAGTDKQRVALRDFGRDEDWDYQRYVDGSGDYIENLAPFPANTWFYVRITRTGDIAFKAEILDENRKVLKAIDDSQSPWNVSFTPAIWRHDNVVTYQDFIIVRKRVLPEPTVQVKRV